MKKVLLAVVALAVVGVVAVMALNKDNENPQPASVEPTQVVEDKASANENEVEIENFAYGPATTTVKKGTTITWTNKDSVQHTVTPDETSEAFTGSGLLAKDQTYSFTFNTAGEFSYHCQPHPQMTGKIVVTE